MREFVIEVLMVSTDYKSARVGFFCLAKIHPLQRECCFKLNRFTDLVER